MARRLLIIAAALLPLGCSDLAAPESSVRQHSGGGSAAEVTLAVDGTRFQHGDTLEAVLTNVGNEPIGYNLCLSARERQESGGEWTRIESLRYCTGAIYNLEAGESERWREPVDPGWGVGTFRLLTPVYEGEGLERRIVVSGSFEVEG
ncbi:MAG: hypothetical protein WD737_02100 [Gemmatimonadota bacterium]